LKLVSTFALALAMTIPSTTGAAAQETPVTGVPGPEQDPYIWLEEARSPEALDWVAKENTRTLVAFEADPRFAQLKAEALAIFDSEDRIPFVSFRPDGLYNFWQDKANPKGLLRRTSLERSSSMLTRSPRRRARSGSIRVQPACRPRSTNA